MGKVAGSVSIIGGADGPTSIFIAGKSGKTKLTTRMRNYFHRIKRNRIKKRLTAKSFSYQEQRKCLKATLVMRHCPDLLGERVDLKPPEREDMEALKAFWEQLQEQEKRAAEIADDIFPLDFHIYEIRGPKNCKMQIGVETVWQVLDASYSGDKRSMKQLKKLSEEIYLYYGVAAEDIKNQTERYQSLLAILSS